MRKSVVDYSGRQLDLEILSHVEIPVSQVVVPEVGASSGMGSGMVAGVQKMVQRYVNLFLTEAGSVKFADDIGGSLLGDISAGRVQSEAYLSFVVELANRSAKLAMEDDDADDAFGSQPDDEKIKTADVESVEVDGDRSTVRVSIRLVTQADSSYTFIIPVKTGIML